MIFCIEKRINKSRIIKIAGLKSVDQGKIFSPDTVRTVDPVFIRAVRRNGIQMGGFGPRNKYTARYGICFQHTDIKKYRRSLDQGTTNFFGRYTLGIIPVNPDDHIAIIGSLQQSLTLIIIEKNRIGCRPCFPCQFITGLRRDPCRTTIGSITGITVPPVDPVTRNILTIARRPCQPDKITGCSQFQVLGGRTQDTDIKVCHIHQTELRIIIP